MPTAEVPKGVIIPPGKVKDTIEKTAGYIARNGQQFANRLMKESSDKFAFLREDDPFFKYYKFCLDDYKNNSVASNESILVSSNLSGIKSSTEITKETNPLPIPAKQYFLFDLPYINAIDLKTIKLTAMFYAANHRNEAYLKLFKQHLIKLSAPQFEFLKESHSLNAVFQKFVQQYILCMNPSPELLNKVAQAAQNGVNADYKLTRSLLEKAYIRAENNYKQLRDKAKEKEAIEREKLEYASINWDEFKVVQTIEFTELDKFSELPLPLNKNDLIYRSLQQKRASSLLEEAPPDFDPNEPVSEKPVDSKPIPDLPAQPRPTAPKKGMKIKTAGETRLHKNAGRDSSKTRQGGQMKYVKSPITGELVPEDKFDMHMKIVLRDPKYEQEKQNYLRKNAGSSNLTDSEVFTNIKRLRGETIADTGEQNKRVKVQWDGYKNSSKHVQEHANKQLSKAELEKLKKQRYEEENKIGPQF